MNYRQKAFTAKFATAAECLGVDAKQIVSLKVRERVPSYAAYDLLMDMLHHEAHITDSHVSKDLLQGQGHILDDGTSRVIVVQHETGLEILCVAGSIASLLGLIPLILQCWTRLRGPSPRPYRGHDAEFEVRRLDEKGHLVEEHVPQLAGTAVGFPGFAGNMLTSAVESMETDVRSLREQLRALTKRVQALEKTRQSKSDSAKRKKPRAKTSKVRKKAKGQ
jgi:hypothetical protein